MFNFKRKYDKYIVKASVARHLCIGVCYIIGAMILFIFGLVKPIKCTEKTTAKVVDVVKAYTRSSFDRAFKNYYYNPVYSYTVDGQEVRFRGSMKAQNTYSFVGEVKEIRYNPNDIEEYYEPKSSISIIFVELIMMLLGIRHLKISKELQTLYEE